MLVYYGDYEIDKVYDLNDFQMNNELKFFRVKQKIRKETKIFYKDRYYISDLTRYIVLTDIYFLLFDPVIESKNCGRLLFWGDIRQISSFKDSSLSWEILILNWTNEDNNVI